MEIEHTDDEGGPGVWRAGGRGRAAPLLQGAPRSHVPRLDERQKFHL